MTTWKDFFEQEKKEKYYQDLVVYLHQVSLDSIVYPAVSDILNAFLYTPLNQVKVVILGQDPYHNPSEAHGLAFSVQDGVPFPPSLRNIFLELKSDLGIDIPKSGNLIPWAKEGVLLLNSILTVEQNKPLSHKDIGWEILTDKAIKLVNDSLEHVVFVLWGNSARNKKVLITRHSHFVIESVHPSPLSSHRGFFGSKPFSRANDYLKTNNIKEINWKV